MVELMENETGLKDGEYETSREDDGEDIMTT